MARGLYRFYLYAISSALLIFVIIATEPLLAMLLAFTPLRGSYNTVPGWPALVQPLVFALVGWLSAGTLGGLHYWLIRRDMQNDPSARTSAVRAFFLNITEGLGTLLIASIIGFGAIDNRTRNPGADVTMTVAVGLLTLLVVILLELERRRVPAQGNAALVFQRLHLFGAQAILLFLLTGAFLNDFRFLVGNVLFGPSNLCAEDYCPSYNSLGLVLTLLWFIACWLVYGLATNRDTSRNTRMALHGASLAFGTGYALLGVFIALEVLLSPLFKIPLTLQDVLGYSAQYEFLSPLLLGLLIISVYHILLRNVVRRGLLASHVCSLVEWAIAAVLLAGVFWGGIGYALYTLLQAPIGPDSESWVTILALIISGISYIPLALYIRRRHALDPVATTGTRRGFVLVLLSAGILALVIGGATALYAWGTALLGSPVSNWPQAVHAGLAAAIVGIIVAGIYLWSVRNERLITRHPRADKSPVPTTPTESATLEAILDELLAGRINREEAATRIRALSTSGSTLVVLPG